jgi:ferrous iron transport protein B
MGATIPLSERSKLTVVLLGNPNTGKSTLFSALSGVRQRVGNYPGVTVEKKIGRFELEGRRVDLVDLPGTYSLAPRSPDEMVAVDVLLGRLAEPAPPDAVIAIVDAANLERNLYLVSQVLELGLPTVVAVNMIDLARKRGIEIDAARLEKQLGVPVVVVQANRRIGIEELKRALVRAVNYQGCTPASPFPREFQAEVAALEGQFSEQGRPTPRYLVERLLLDSTGYLHDRLLANGDGRADRAIAASRQRLAEAGHPVPAVEAVARYGWAARALEGVVRHPSERAVARSDRMDRVLTHKLWGTLIFSLLMLLVFSSVFKVAEPLMGWIESGVGWVGERVEGLMSEGPLRSLLVDGVIAGVGSVLVFLPQIAFLFFFIAVLEDCGYMARAAYLMDKLMVRVGLSGKSFIPLLSSFACAVPGIMAARVIENRRDRLTTILVAPLMSCSARLPVYTVLIAAFIPEGALRGFLPGLTLFAMYLVGIVAAVLVAWALKRSLLKGPTPPFVLELPSYKWPSAGLVMHRIAEQSWAFVRRAGTLILAVSVLVWAAAYYPHDAASVEAPFAARQAELADRQAAAAGDARALKRVEDDIAQLDNDIAAAYQRQSILGRMGRLIEPAVRPLGWDWRIGCAAIASFPAREVVISTLGVIYNLGEGLDVGEEGAQIALKEKLRSATWDDTGLPVYNVPVALSIMVFFALCAQCASTLVVMRRETGSWRWPALTFVYMTGLAYLGALATYQIGIRL